MYSENIYTKIFFTELIIYQNSRDLICRDQDDVDHIEHWLFPWLVE